MEGRRVPGNMLSVLIFVIVAGIFSCILFSSCLVNKIGGASSHNPEEMNEGLSSGAKALLERSFQDISADRLTDFHTHVVGTGCGGTGCFINPEMQSWFHPIKKIKTSVFMSASGIRDSNRVDQEYISRLVRLIRSTPTHGKHGILAFDQHYLPDGRVHSEKTEFYVPNEYIFQLVEAYPDLFLPVISVHPYRPDALAELEKWARRGAKYIKWLPNAMGIDPSDPRIDSFYAIMKEFNMVLLSHTGEEQAVDAREDQKWGNPLLLRRPLDQGVMVIMAHCASLGECVDLDSPGQPIVPCFDLFIRLMDEKKYEGILFGEISAQFQFNRLTETIKTVLARGDLHHRLVNGSDYPLPAINVIMRTGDLEKDGFINKEERKYLNEIYDYNPLLFDFVLKRTVKHPQTGKKLPASVFMANPILGL